MLGWGLLLTAGGWSRGQAQGLIADDLAGERAAVRRTWVDPAGTPRVGAWWWDAAEGGWSPAPSAAWHAAVWQGDARRRWVEVVAVRHVTCPARGRLALVLDGGAWPSVGPERGERRAKAPLGGAKLVAMSTLTGGVVDAWWFDAGHEVVDGSAWKDFVVDASGSAVVIHDAGTAGLVVVDLASRRTHRALVGCVPAEARVELDEARGWLVWWLPSGGGWRVPWAEVRDARFDGVALRHLVEAVTDATAGVSPASALGAEAARRWWLAGAWRGLGGDEAGAVLRREAARGAAAAAEAAGDTTHNAVSAHPIP